jgi:hypothetical protein
LSQQPSSLNDSDLDDPLNDDGGKRIILVLTAKELHDRVNLKRWHWHGSMADHSLFVSLFDLNIYFNMI